MYVSSRHFLVSIAFASFLFQGCVFQPTTSATTRTTLVAEAKENGRGETPELTQARKNLVLTLRELRDGFDLSSFGEYNGCHASDPNLCAYALQATSAQKDFLRDFLAKGIDPILKLNTQEPMTAFSLHEQPISVTNPAGQPVAANAWTTLGPIGPINLFAPSVEHFTSLALLAEISHEFGHKFSYDGSGRPIQDNDVVGPFNSPIGGGRFALDAFGAFLATYYADHIGRVPVLFPDANVTCSADDLTAQMTNAPLFVGDSSGSSVAQGQPSADATRVFKSIDAGDFTAEAWVKLDADAAGDTRDSSARYIFSNLDNSDHFIGGLELLRMPNGNFGSYVGTEIVYDSGIALTADTFHHVVVRKLANTISFVVDGVAGQSYGTSDGTIQTFITAQVGTRGKPASNTWKGQIARLAFYGQALSDEQLEALYRCH